jgi:DNA-binding NtrC family response regulator
MVKVIKHGACDYMVKPVHPEKVRNIWMHAVRKSKSNPRNKVSSGSDNPCQMVQYVDDNMWMMRMVKRMMQSTLGKLEEEQKRWRWC